MQTDLAFIAAEAQRRADDYKAFAYYVEIDDRSDEALDHLVDTLAEPIIQAIDCTQCANCCRVLDVYLTREDATYLAQVVPVETISRLLDYERAACVEEWAMFGQKPCHFLKDNLCTVYENRPESCRVYPAFTPDFRWLIGDILGGVGLCPIIYNVIEALQKEMNW